MKKIILILFSLYCSFALARDKNEKTPEEQCTAKIEAMARGMISQIAGLSNKTAPPPAWKQPKAPKKEAPAEVEKSDSKVKVTLGNDTAEFSVADLDECVVEKVVISHANE